MNEYEVIWDGRHDGVNRDLLCVPAVPVRVIEERDRPTLPYEPWGDVEERLEFRAKLVSLLGERPTWRIRELRTALDINGRFIYGALTTLIRHDVIRKVSHGTYALRRDKAAA